MARVVQVFEECRVTFDAALELFLSVCRAKNLSPNTIAYYRYRLQAFVRRCRLDPCDVKPADIRDFLTHERETNSATTACHSLTALRAFFGALIDDGLIAENPALAVDKPKRRKTVIPTLSTQQVAALLATCKRDFYGVRDCAIILTLLDTGVRVSELVTASLEDVSLELQQLKVIGKGDRERVVPFGSGVRAAVSSYLARRGDAGNRQLFVNHYGEPITRHGVARMLHVRAGAAGITGVRVSPHTFRHTFAKSWLINGGDALSLQKMLGHSSLEMVKNYVNLVADEVSAVHRAVSPVDRMTASAAAKAGKRRLK